MQRKTRRPSVIAPSAITPEGVYQQRRALLRSMVAAGLSIGGMGTGAASLAQVGGTPWQYQRNPKYSVDDAPNSLNDITTYNNFYEFGTDKADPAALSHGFKPKPWTVNISGEAEITGHFTFEDVIKPHALEERIYRFRCVEAWSMIVPWLGFPLRDLLARFKPTSRAKYVAFKTIVRPEEMPGQRSRVLDWPYVEGLRMDEAMHPLTLLAVGLYGQALPNQNGAPLRLIVPWKYGFKSIKSIVEIAFVEKQPPSTWNLSNPGEYGFYSNVNPNKDHPRWSQASERRIGGNIGLFSKRQPTLMFNGYADQVASLYTGMDLNKFY